MDAGEKKRSELFARADKKYRRYPRLRSRGMRRSTVAPKRRHQAKLMDHQEWLEQHGRMIADHEMRHDRDMAEIRNTLRRAIRLSVQDARRQRKRNLPRAPQLHRDAPKAYTVHPFKGALPDAVVRQRAARSVRCRWRPHTPPFRIGAGSWRSLLTARGALFLLPELGA